MTNHFSYFVEISEAVQAEEDRRILQIFSSAPIEEVTSKPDISLNVARWQPGVQCDDFWSQENQRGAWEFHGTATPNYHGINEAPFLFYGHGPDYPAGSLYFPFTPTDKPGEFLAISRLLSNPRLDRLQFKKVADEVTLYRLHAYDPPSILTIPFRRVPTAELPWRAAIEFKAAQAAEKVVEAIRNLPPVFLRLAKD